MGVERAVTRWYILRQPIVDEIAALEAQLYQPMSPTEEPQTARTQAFTEYERGNDKDRELQLQLQRARARLHALGPCPKPMMG